MKTILLGDKPVGGSGPCYVIAEIGGNFRTVEEGKRLIDLAASASVDAVKLQTFRAESLTTRSALFDMENTGVRSQFEHFRAYELDERTHQELFAHATERGLFSFSTPSHQTDADMLDQLGVRAHKIGSDDATNLPFLRHVARLQKPVILSTGMCTLSEVQRAVDAFLEEGNDQLILMHCTTSYPTHIDAVNLRAMVSMQRTFPFPVGYSDHTLGTDTCYAAAVLGAPILEFHFTHDKQAEGPDHMISKEPEEAADLVRRLRELPRLLGDGIKRPAASEMLNRRNNRKSLVVATDVARGERFTRESLTVKRPGHGVASEHLDSVLGRTAVRDLAVDTVLTWDDLG